MEISSNYNVLIISVLNFFILMAKISDKSDEWMSLTPVVYVAVGNLVIHNLLFSGLSRSGRHHTNYRIHICLVKPYSQLTKGHRSSIQPNCYFLQAVLVRWCSSLGFMKPKFHHYSSPPVSAGGRATVQPTI